MTDRLHMESVIGFAGMRNLPESYREVLLLVRNGEIEIGPTPQQRRVLDRLCGLDIVRFRRVRTIIGATGAHGLTAAGKELIQGQS